MKPRTLNRNLRRKVRTARSDAWLLGCPRDHSSARCHVADMRLIRLKVARRLARVGGAA